MTSQAVQTQSVPSLQYKTGMASDLSLRGVMEELFLVKKTMSFSLSPECFHFFSCLGLAELIVSCFAESAKQRRSLYQVAQRMSQQFGPQWTESATMLSQLEPHDIQELEQGIVCQNEYIRMFSVSGLRLTTTYNATFQHTINHVM